MHFVTYLFYLPLYIILLQINGIDKEKNKDHWQENLITSLRPVSLGSLTSSMR